MFKPVAVGRARKKRCDMLRSESRSTRIAADPAQRANELLGSWLEKPLGVEVVVPITVCKERED